VPRGLLRTASTRSAARSGPDSSRVPTTLPTTTPKPSTGTQSLLIPLLQAQTVTYQGITWSANFPGIECAGASTAYGVGISQAVVTVLQVSDGQTVFRAANGGLTPASAAHRQERPTSSMSPSCCECKPPGSSERRLNHATSGGNEACRSGRKPCSDGGTGLECAVLWGSKGASGLTQPTNGAKMRFRTLVGAAMMAAVATGLVGTTSIASAAHSSTPPMAYTCTGGARPGLDPSAWTFVPIPSGTYSSLTVTGVCQTAPGAVINVVGNVNVAAGAVLDAQSFPSTITVGHNVIAASGSLLGLGCLPNPTGHTTGHPCIDPTTGTPTSTTEYSTITVDGNVIATDADTVLLNGITVNGNVVLTGGGEDVNVWPIKDNTILGNLIVSGVTPNWLGVMVNHIGGNAILTNITITDPGDPTPTIFIASNTVGQNLICTGLGPYVAGGFPGEHNVVGNKAIGQCANLQDV
jgi:hypothetical protein